MTKQDERSLMNEISEDASRASKDVSTKLGVTQIKEKDKKV